MHWGKEDRVQGTDFQQRGGLPRWQSTAILANNSKGRRHLGQQLLDKRQQKLNKSETKQCDTATIGE